MFLKRVMSWHDIVIFHIPRVTGLFFSVFFRGVGRREGGYVFVKNVTILPTNLKYILRSLTVQFYSLI